MTSWLKSKPHWLRGGIIGLISLIILSVLIFPLTVLGVMVIGAVLGYGPENQGLLIIISYIVLVIPGFIIGAIIGALIENTKKIS